tara:strand:- start:294 stop:1118 length:825 start_codon:yes stop_codon:yes gene_type:complete
MAIDRDLNLQLIAAALATARGDNVGDALAQGGLAADKFKLRETKVAQAQADLEQTQLKNIKLGQEITGEGQQIQVPEREYSLEEQNQDLLIAEAFGTYDAIETGVADFGSFLGLAPAGGYESQIAEAKKKELNFAIKATAADAWRGKPNNFLLQQIIELIPSNYLQGDSKAAARYSTIRTNFESRMSELDGQIQNADPGSAAQANLVKTRANVKYIIDRLTVVEQGFKGLTPQDDSITADSFYGVSGITPGTPLEMSEASLDAMSQAYKEFLEE